MFETQKTGNKTSSGEIGLNIRTHELYGSPNVGQDQIFAGVSVLNWQPHPLQILYGNLAQLGEKSNSVIRSSSVTRSKIDVGGCHTI